VWPSIFHAVSAFCNAGFSTFSDSLMGFQTNLPLLAVVMLLVVVGGIGFLTLEELSLWWRSQPERWSDAPRRRFRLSTHSQLVLLTTAGLVVAGGVAFTLIEWRHALADLPTGARLVNGLFASVTPRTAGFSTIDYGSAHPSTNVLTIILMTIGGSPGSTAGGIKTTTFALLGLVAFSRLRGLPTTNVFGRTLPETTVRRAIGLFVLAVGLMTAAVLVLTLTELPGPLASAAPGTDVFAVLFEAVSAFNTAGLSMGATNELSTAGRWTTVAAMFIGRVGPLTLAAALAHESSGGDFRYAYEDVMVG
jgi:trk system potassium uptake protein TrkH